MIMLMQKAQAYLEKREVQLMKTYTKNPLK